MTKVFYWIASLFTSKPIRMKDDWYYIRGWKISAYELFKPKTFNELELDQKWEGIKEVWDKEQAWIREKERDIFRNLRYPSDEIKEKK